MMRWASIFPIIFRGDARGGTRSSLQTLRDALAAAPPSHDERGCREADMHHVASRPRRSPRVAAKVSRVSAPAPQEMPRENSHDGAVTFASGEVRMGLAPPERLVVIRSHLRTSAHTWSGTAELHLRISAHVRALMFTHDVLMCTLVCR